jgi:hypothetical protein
MERLCADYLAHLRMCDSDREAIPRHDQYIAEIIEQMVRREPFGTSQQSPLRRAVERMLLGDARKRGETHQWMYDRISLPNLLEEAGYRDVTVERYDTSRIPDWNRHGLDRKAEGGEYKPGSLYVEAAK